MRFKIISVAVAVAVCGAGSAAAVSISAASKHGALGPAHHGPAVIEVSRVKNYASLAGLRKESTAVAMVTAAAARVTAVNGVPATVTTLQVKRVGWGAALPATIDVLQLGTDSALSPDTSQLFVHGNDYLVYVTRYHLHPGDHTGLYVVTGDQGVFAVRDATLVFSGGGNPGFGRQIALSDWLAVVNR